jgi:hypothetical protein
MLRRRTLALFAALALLALPASSFAQGSAGDDQYQDPLAGQGGGGSTSTQQTPSSGTTSGGGTTTGGGTTSTGTAPTTTAPTTTASGQTTTTVTTTGPEGTQAAPGELPRTGGDPIMVFVFGIAMLMMGTGLRTALPARD